MKVTLDPTWPPVFTVFAENDIDAAVMAYVQEQLKAGDGFVPHLLMVDNSALPPAEWRGNGFTLTLASVEAERKLTRQRTRFRAVPPTVFAKIAALKAVREATGIGLKEAKDVVEGGLFDGRSWLGREEQVAADAAAALEAHGCRIRWEE